MILMMSYNQSNVNIFRMKIEHDMIDDDDDGDC